MKKLLQVIIYVSVLLMITACSSESKKPEVIRHSLPDLTLDTTWIESAGCQRQDITSNHFYASCPLNSALGGLGCEEIVSDILLGGLPYPVVICQNYSNAVDEPFFSKVGCYLSTRKEAHLMFMNGNYQLVDNKDLQTIAAPIESTDEALSYILATTKYYAMYDIEIETYFHYYANKIEETYVKETPNGFLVHLFSDQEPYCGCGKHYTNAVDILVHKDGSTKFVKSRPFFEFNGCVD